MSKNAKVAQELAETLSDEFFPPTGMSYVEKKRISKLIGLFAPLLDRAYPQEQEGTLIFMTIDKGKGPGSHLVIQCPGCQNPRFADYTCPTCEREELPSAPGTWSWALARMKEGKRVRRRIWPNGYWLCFDSNALVDEHGRVPLIMQTDFDATDWQLAKENQ